MFNFKKRIQKRSKKAQNKNMNICFKVIKKEMLKNADLGKEGYYLYEIEGVKIEKSILSELKNKFNGFEIREFAMDDRYTYNINWEIIN